MKFVWVPAGSFMMGSPKEEKGRVDNETQHKGRLARSGPSVGLGFCDDPHHRDGDLLLLPLP